jgi:GNAT superfamily N-acetyltransferase
MSTSASFLIRRATRADLPSLGRLGALLMRIHHDFDAKRFMMPGGNPEEGYSWFLGEQLEQDDAVVLVATRLDGGEVIGYAYAGLEPMSWRELREACGFVHDVAVDPTARREGVATALMQAAIDWLKQHGAPRVVLWTAARNNTARQLFAQLGFRETMVEMTREL